MKDEQTLDEAQLAKRNWCRYEYGISRGHREFCRQARVLEGMYLGGGLQWSREDLEALACAGKPAFEFNQILPKINTALGYQIANRVDIAYMPRNSEATEELGTVLSKLAMQVADNVGLHWHETQVYGDGLIQQRGYFELSISYEDTILGEIDLQTLDPMDVIPDPDAKSYDPDDWADVIITKWLTYDEIERLYGKQALGKIEAQPIGDDDFGEGEQAERNRFGDMNVGFGEFSIGDGQKRVRVIDRQAWQMAEADCIITPTGDIRVVEGLPPERVAAMLEQGGMRTRRRTRRIRWTVTAASHVLHDDWSPFQHFTVVPYFPFFRRGVTRGLVDNAKDPQQLLNKSLSQFLHIINTTANSGWITWANTINNLRSDELEERGAETGLHIELRGDTAADKMPRKIQPNQIPNGLDRLVDRSALLLEQATGINEAMMGQRSAETSGVAIQSRQHAAQQQLAVPLDNLAYTRRLLAKRILALLQSFYDMPRIERITGTGATGENEVEQLMLNWPAGDQILNDLTIGEYDVVVSEQPMQVTFENSQFTQVMEMIERGIPIPPAFVLRYSNLTHKQEIIEAIQQQGADPMTEAKVALTEAQAEKVRSEGVSKSVEAMYSAMQAANVIAVTPQTSPLADDLLKSAGFEDKNSAPIVPEYSGGAPVADVAEMAPTNYDPFTPAGPATGMNQGIRTPENDGA